MFCLLQIQMIEMEWENGAFYLAFTIQNASGYFYPLLNQISVL